MSWIEYHRVSERLASDAQAALRDGDSERARALYARAADAEYNAIAGLDAASTRTFAISWVSVASLYYKAGMVERAEQIAWRGLNLYSFPDFAKIQLRHVLQSIWSNWSNWNNLTFHTPFMREQSTKVITTIEKWSWVGIEDDDDRFLAGVNNYVEKLDTKIVEKEVANNSTFVTNEIPSFRYIKIRESMPLSIVSGFKANDLLIGHRRVRMDTDTVSTTEATSTWMSRDRSRRNSLVS